MRRTLLLPLVLLVLTFVGLAACGEQAAKSSSLPGHATAGMPAQAPPAGTATNPADTSAPLPAPVPSDKLIRTARITLQVGSGKFDDTLTALIALAGREQGFVSASNASSAEGRLRTGVFTFSVPTAQFEASIGEIRQMGTVQAIDVSSQDVKAQYVDLQARLQNAQAQRDAMLALLQQAKSVQDIIAVQNQLGQITGLIEQLKGQIDYLDHATSYSTITVTLREAGVAAPPPSDLANLRDALAQGLHAFLLSLGAILVVLVAAGPYLLVAGAGLWAWWARRRPARTGME